MTEERAQDERADRVRLSGTGAGLDEAAPMERHFQRIELKHRHRPDRLARFDQPHQTVDRSLAQSVPRPKRAPDTQGQCTEVRCEFGVISRKLRPQSAHCVLLAFAATRRERIRRQAARCIERGVLTFALFSANAALVTSNGCAHRAIRRVPGRDPGAPLTPLRGERRPQMQMALVEQHRRPSVPCADSARCAIHARIRSRSFALPGRTRKRTRALQSLTRPCRRSFPSTQSTTSSKTSFASGARRAR